jgi:hypothetical protein
VKRLKLELDWPDPVLSSSAVVPPTQTRLGCVSRAEADDPVLAGIYVSSGIIAWLGTRMNVDADELLAHLRREIEDERRAPSAPAAT